MNYYYYYVFYFCWRRPRPLAATIFVFSFLFVALRFCTPAGKNIQIILAICAYISCCNVVNSEMVFLSCLKLAHILYWNVIIGLLAIDRWTFTFGTLLLAYLCWLWQPAMQKWLNWSRYHSGYWLLWTQWTVYYMDYIWEYGCHWMVIEWSDILAIWAVATIAVATWSRLSLSSWRRSSADAKGPCNLPQVRNAALEKTCSGNDLQGYSRSLQWLLLDRPYITFL